MIPATEQDSNFMYRDKSHEDLGGKGLQLSQGRRGQMKVFKKDIGRTRRRTCH